MMRKTVTIESQVYDYPTRLLAEELDRLQERIRQKRFLGTSRKDAEVVKGGFSLKHVSHVVWSAKLRDGPEGPPIIEAEVEPLDTPSGKALADLMESDGAEFGIVGMGIVRGGEKPTVQDGFHLIQFAWHRKGE
jgi:hypothetical protein